MREESLIKAEASNWRKRHYAESLWTPGTNYLQASAQRAMLSGGSLGKAIGSATLRFASLLMCVEKEEKKLGDIG